MESANTSHPLGKLTTNYFKRNQAIKSFQTESLHPNHHHFSLPTNHHHRTEITNSCLCLFSFSRAWRRSLCQWQWESGEQVELSLISSLSQLTAKSEKVKHCQGTHNPQTKKKKRLWAWAPSKDRRRRKEMRKMSITERKSLNDKLTSPHPIWGGGIGWNAVEQPAAVPNNNNNKQVSQDSTYTLWRGRVW